MPGKNADHRPDRPAPTELEEAALDAVQGGAALAPVEVHVSMKHEVREHVSFTYEKLERSQ